MRFFLILLASFFLLSCGNDGVGVDGLNSASKEILPDHRKTPLKNELGHMQAVIEIPAGTNHKYEYNYDSKSFECEIIDGKERVVKFLPYPGNYGFLPGTLMDKDRGGDGDALDVLILGETVPQGSVLAIQPIATLKLLDRGEEDHKIIAVPLNKDLNVLGISSYNELPESVKQIVQTWFASYKGPGKMEFQNWEGDSSTLAEIKKWAK